LSPVGLLVALGVVVAVTALAPGAGAASTSLVINEVDYDQPSTDDAEFLELRNISGTAINLGPYAVELVNGNNGGAVVYQTIDLPDVTLAGNSGAPYTEGSGVGLVDTAAAAEGLSRCPDGSDTDQGNVDFALRATSPGSANACPPPGPPFGACGDSQETPINVIQGPGATSPVSGSERVSEAVVVGDFRGIRGLERLLRAGGGRGCGR
jgi:predicted extracellular nuclease